MGHQKPDKTSAPRHYRPSPVRLSPKDPRTIWVLLRKTVSKWNDDPVLRFGAALAYYTAFTIIPLMVVVLEMASLFDVRNAEAALLKQIEDIVGQQSAGALRALLDEWQRVGSTGVVLGVASATLFIGAAGAFDQLQDALNAIWGVKPKTQEGMLVRLRRRFVSTLGFLGTAFLLLVSLAASAGLAAVAQAVSAWLPGPEIIGKSVSAAMSFAVVAVLFAMIFKLLPQAQVAWSDVWTGAFITAALFTIGKLFIALYLGSSILVTLYGPAGSFVLIMLWAYYASHLLLFGAEFTAVYACDCGSRIVPTPDAMAVGEPAKTSVQIEGQKPHPGTVSS